MHKIYIQSSRFFVNLDNLLIHTGEEDKGEGSCVFFTTHGQEFCLSFPTAHYSELFYNELVLAIRGSVPDNVVSMTLELDICIKTHKGVWI